MGLKAAPIAILGPALQFDMVAAAPIAILGLGSSGELKPIAILGQRRIAI